MSRETLVHVAGFGLRDLVEVFRCILNEKLRRRVKTFGSDGLPVRLSGEWIRRKHHYLDRYCAITATGMKNRFSERVFLQRRVRRRAAN
jgi:hypothetical protein